MKGRFIVLGISICIGMMVVATQQIFFVAQPGVTYANFQRIERNMEEKDVEKLFGCKGDGVEPLLTDQKPEENAKTWFEKNAMCLIFFRKGFVVDKHFYPDIRKLKEITK